jgi:hypothetical protein
MDDDRGPASPAPLVPIMTTEEQLSWRRDRMAGVDVGGAGALQEQVYWIARLLSSSGCPSIHGAPNQSLLPLCDRQAHP